MLYRYLQALCLILFLSTPVLKAATTASPPSGNGTEATPYLISNLAELRWLSETWSVWEDQATFRQTADIDASETSTWNSGAGFSPIGKARGFNGRFECLGGFSISNLTINRPSEDGLGLFNLTEGAELVGIKLTGVNITGRKWVGMLAGYTTTGGTTLIYNCSANGSISATGEWVGGLVGQGDYLIIHCSTTGSVSGDRYVGGLAGECTRILNSYSQADVFTDNTNGGGLVGKGSEIVNAYAAGAVTGDHGVEGGFSGGSNANYVHYACFYDTTATGKTSPVPPAYTEPAGVQGFPTANMQQIETFAGWDFQNTWEINSGYPTLRATPQETAASAPSGSGTEASPYLISNLAELRWVSETSSSWDKHFRLTANVDATETSAWNRGLGFDPIGDSTTSFTGRFDSAGDFTINNLSIYRPAESEVGLFGHVENGELVGLKLTDASIRGGDNYVGILAGNAGVSTYVYDSSATGNVFGSNYVGGLLGRGFQVAHSFTTGNVNGDGYVGGLVGSGGRIINCYSHAHVTSTNHAGALLGGSSGSVVNCYATGAVSASVDAGGLVGTGSADDMYLSCYFDTETTGQTADSGSGGDRPGTTGLPTANMQQANTFMDWDFAHTWEINGDYPTLRAVDSLNQTQASAPSGGDGSSDAPFEISSLAELRWVSENPTEWSKSFRLAANIDATETRIWRSGSGFAPIGRYTDQVTLQTFEGTFDNPGGFSITNLFVAWEGKAGLFGYPYYATISGLKLINSTTVGNGDTGSLAGHVRNTGIDSVDIINCTVVGTGVTGGLVGRHEGGTDYSTKNCYVTGRVTTRYAGGGLLGLNSGGTVEDSYAIVDLVVRYEHVIGEFAGGLVGYNSGGTISRCYSAGIIDSPHASHGLVGQFVSGAPTITSSFYDSSVVGSNFTPTPFSGITPKTTAEMQSAATFTSAGWDFDSVWGIVDGYPVHERNLPEYTVTFNRGVGTHSGGGALSQLVLHGRAATAPLITPPVGKNFAGWDKTFDPVTETMTVTAQYTTVTYPVTFDIGIGTQSGGGALSQTIDHAQPATAPIVDPPNYATFTGWDVAFDSITAATAVTAQYTLHAYTVTFDLAGGSRIGGGLLSQDIVYGNPALAPQLTPPVGKVFDSWDVAFDNITGTTSVTAQYVTATYLVTFDLDGLGTRTGGGLLNQTIDHGQPAAAPTVDPAYSYHHTGWDVAFDVVTGPLTVTAQYALNTYQVDFDLDGGTRSDGGALTQNVTHGTGAVAPLVTPPVGLAFDSWDVAFDNVVGPLTVTAQYVAATYTVIFDLDIGTRTGGGELSQTITHGQPASAPTFSVPNYATFSHWDTTFTSITGPTTVTAQYTVNTYPVTFVLGVGTRDGGGALSQDVEHGQPAIVPGVQPPVGQELSGWDVDFSSITGPLTVTAEYQTGEYDVTFVLGNGTSTSGGALNQTITHGDPATAPNITPNTGHLFTGWDTAFNSVISDLTVTAQYALEQYAVTFDVGAGTDTQTGGALNQTISYGQAATPPVVTPPAGYVFSSWSGGDINSITGPTSFTAVYTVPSYTVTFEIGGGTRDEGGSELAQSIPHGSAAIAPTVVPPVGYTLASWDVAFDNVTGPLTVTAQYAIRTYTVTFSINALGTHAGGGALSQTIDHGQPATSPNVTPVAGFTFEGWSDDISSITDDLDVTAVFASTDPNADTDGDGILDSVEVDNGLNPLDPRDSDWDLDGDGVPNFGEVQLGSDMTDDTSPTRLYVTTDGDDTTGDGSDGAPYATVQKAVDEATGTTAIVIGSGTFATSATLKDGIALVGANQVSTVLDGGDSSNVLKVSDSARVAIVGLTVTRGNSNSSSGEYRNGSGLYAVNANLYVAAARFIDNYVQLNGGGIYHDGGFLRLVDSDFRDNRMHTGYSRQGGGLCLDDVAFTILRTEFRNNQGDATGGVALREGSAGLLENCLIANNNATDGVTARADGISLEGSSSATIRNCTIAYNGGFGVDVNASSATVVNSILWENGDDLRGTVTLLNSCVQDGDAGTNVITADPTFRSVVLQDYRLHQDSPCIDAGDGNEAPDFDAFGNARSDVANIADTGIGTLSFTDLGYHEFQVGDLDDDGDGMTNGYETANGLDSTSPHDADTDLDGDGIPNYGEFILGSAANDSTSPTRLYVAIEGDDITGDGGVGTPYATVQKAVDEAIGTTAIVIGSGTFATNATLKDGIALVGADQVSTVLDGGDSSNVLKVSDSARVAIVGLTVTRGNSNSSSGEYRNGSGLYAVNANLYVAAARFIDNYVQLNGGGIYHDGGFLRLVDSDFRDNRMHTAYVGRGGGLCLDDVAFTILRTEFRNNQGDATGGVALREASAGLLENCLVANNNATEGVTARADGISLEGSSSATIRNCTIAYNNGFGVDMNGSSLTVINSILWENGDDLRGTVTLLNSCVQDGDAGTNVITTDPTFRSVVLQDYRLHQDSACIDAGDGNEAPDFDAFGNARSDVANIADTGIGTLSFTDLGYHEFQVGDLDDDGDGMTNGYETANGLDSSSPNDADTDLDGDGIPNYGEFILGSAANDANDPARLHVALDGVDETGDGSDLAPFRSIQTAVTAATGTTAIVVGPGIHPTNAMLKDGIAIVGDGHEASILDGGDANRVLEVPASANVVIAGVSISNGSVTGSGAGLHATSATVYLNGVKLNDHTVTDNGGAIYQDAGFLRIVDCMIEDNSTTVSSSNYGGGCFIDDVNFMVLLTEFRRNYGYYGGAAVIRGTSIGLFQNCLIVDNDDNSSGAGDGLELRDTSSTRIRSCTIAHNEGDGVRTGETAELLVVNSILWGNGDDVEDDSGLGMLTDSCIEDLETGTNLLHTDPLFRSVAGEDYRLSQGSSCIDVGAGDDAPAFDFFGNARADISGVADTGSGTPTYVDLGYHEFQLEDLDSDGDGMTDGYETANGLDPAAADDADTDLDGDGIPNYGEFILGSGPNDANDPVRLYVSESGSDIAGDGSAGAPFASVGAAVTAATGTTAIAVGAGTFATGATLKDGIALVGAGQDVTILDGADTNRVLTVPASATVVIAGIQIFDGAGVTGAGLHATDATVLVSSTRFTASEVTDHGGAIYQNGGTLRIVDCLIDNNTTSVASGNYGGGIYLEDVGFSIQRSEIRQNIGWYNGGLSVHGASVGVIENCLFAENLDNEIGFADAMEVYDTSDVTLRNCTVANNGSRAFEVHANASLSLVNSIVWEHSVKSIHMNSGATLNMSNTCIEHGGTGTNVITDDPLFVDLANGDYRLTAASPCIDVADGSVAPAFDFEGDPRWDHPGVTNADATAADMGYDEFYGRFTVTFDLGAGTQPDAVALVQDVDLGQDATAPAVDPPVGYTHGGWDIGFTGVDSDRTVTAIYQLNDVQIETSVATVTVGEGGSQAVDVRLTAEPTATVDVALTVTGSSEVTAERLGSAVASFTTANWDMWQTVTIEAAEDADLTDDAATVTLSTSGADDMDVSVSVSDDDFLLTITTSGSGTATNSLNVDPENPPVSITAISATGHHFTGWSVLAGSGAFGDDGVAPTTFAPTGTATIQAAFAINQYTVTFDLDGKATTTDPTAVQVDHGSDATAPSLTVNPGYNHTGWAEALTGIESDVTIAATYSTLAPVLDLNGAAAGTNLTRMFASTDPLIPVGAADSTITEVAEDQLSSATISLPDTALGETLSMASTVAGLTIGFDPGTGVLSATGVADSATYLTFLREARYQIPLENATTTMRTLSVTVVGIGGSSNTASVVINGDDDADGLADRWEWQFFGALTRDGSSDLDGDTETDAAEFLAGTDPTDATSTDDPANAFDEVNFEFYRVRDLDAARAVTAENFGMRVLNRTGVAGQLTLPDASTAAITADVVGYDSGEFSSLAALQAACPSGVYEVEFAGLGIIAKFAVADYTADDFATYPEITSPDADAVSVSILPQIDFDSVGWDELDILHPISGVTYSATNGGTDTSHTVSSALDANTDYLLITSHGAQFRSTTTQAFTTGSEAVFEFQRGWTLFSVPFNTGKTVGDLFPGRASDAVMFRWDAASERYVRMQTDEILQANQAYRVYTEDGAGLHGLTGDQVSNEVDLQQGWNFFGPTKTMPIPTDARLKGSIIGFNEQTRRLFRLKDSERLPDWQQPGMLMQRRAYWIYAKEDFTLDLD